MTKKEESDFNFNNFIDEHKNAELSNLKLVKFKSYSYFEMFKIFSNNFHEEQFINSKRALFLTVAFPPAVLIGFIVANPFSYYRNVFVFASVLGSYMNFVYCIQDDIRSAAREETIMGLSLRERYKTLSIYDPNFPTFREYTERTVH